MVSNSSDGRNGSPATSRNRIPWHRGLLKSCCYWNAVLAIGELQNVQIGSGRGRRHPTVHLLLCMRKCVHLFVVPSVVNCTAK
ncbi:unnamed protein product [Onchocerca flexuosa]|uniref:Uncharacterized protein n=1 Tax=Onchocerca flexuosa TaxID=387005 RepID=A0A183HAW4_9BILA|nr:unnamed protein product [Onchocerca flexuosa]